MRHIAADRERSDGVRPARLPTRRSPPASAAPEGHELDRVLSRHRPTGDGAGSILMMEDRGAPEPDDEVIRLQAPDAGVTRPDAGTSPADAGVPASRTASLTVTEGSYVDTATESKKDVKFEVTWSGGSKEDYVIVNWVKGYAKNPKGKPFRASLYGSLADTNFPSWKIDSVDADPVYWSDKTGRWNYNTAGANKFWATDSPGPMRTSMGKGTEAKLDFKTGVYKAADVPTTTTGTISATPLHSLQPWSYHVLVEGGGRFKHS
jgi:hypothetical protein